MSNQNSPSTPWATLSFSAHLRDTPIDALEGAMAAAVDQLDALGALIAELEGVGGVETRDPALFGSTAARPELVVYTTPPHLESIEARGRSWASGMGLEVDVEPEVRTDDDWRDSWKKFYAHMIFGEGDLLLRPSWLERREGDPTCEIVLDPGRAFGTGYHESTRLCLEALMKLARQGERAARVLDLGCGSGILALAYAKRVVSDARPHLCFVDIDPEAVDTSRENVELNGLAVDDERIEFIVGGADATPQTFDLVIANIRPEVLVPHANEIRARVDTGGKLLLSGILLEESQRVHDAYASLGLEHLEQIEENDWCAQLWRRPT